MGTMFQQILSAYSLPEFKEERSKKRHTFAMFESSFVESEEAGMRDSAWMTCGIYEDERA